MVRHRALIVALALPLLALAAPSPFSLHCNSSLHFDCHDSIKPCIPLEWMCDGVHDCPSGQDESRCNYLHECSARQLMCRNGECISESFRCDGMLDCSDGTDEKGCDEMDEIKRSTANIRPTQPSSPFHTTPAAPRRVSIRPAQCGHREYQCRDGACITEEAKCDGVWDCPNGDDETECNEPLSIIELLSTIGGSCKHGYHMCADRKACVPPSWKCDGEPDCDDGSDEAHCDVTSEEEVNDLIQERMRERSEASSSNDSSTQAMDDLPSAHEFLSNADYVLCDEGHFRCKGGKCINASSTCDGKTDCPLGDDESVRCGECASSASHDCSHQCTNTPTGPKCSCPRGMQLESNGHTCEDVDECLREGERCSQHCRNMKDGYECYCGDGYKLGTDKHTCALQDKYMDGMIYVSLAAEIRSAPMFSPQHSRNGYETVVATNHEGTTKNLAVDVDGERIFTAMEPKTNEGVLAMIENGELKRLRENITGINYVAYDWIGKNVLYTVRHPSPSPGIYLCKDNGLYCKRIVEGVRANGRKQNYRGLAVNPLRGIIAWIDVTENDHRIMMAKMDGTGVRALVNHKLSYPSGIAFDVVKNEVYFSDVDTKLIEKINVETGRRSTVIYPVNHPYALAYFNNLIYWTEWGTETLKVAAVGAQHSTPHLVHGFLQFPYGISLNHTLAQPRVSVNPCDEMECPYMCTVTVSSSYGSQTESLIGKCVCPEEYEENVEYGKEATNGSPCKLRSDLNRTEISSALSRVSVEALEEYCISGAICVNGGICVEHRNDHGRADRISCKCRNGYGGLWCEEKLEKAAMDAINEEYESDEYGQDSDSAISFWTILLIVLLLGVIAGLVWLGSRNSDEITKVTRTTLTRVQEARLPERASEAVRATTRNLGLSPVAFSRSARNSGQQSAAAAAGSSTSAAAAAGQQNVYPSLVRNSSSTTLPQSSSTITFSNPAFDDEHHPQQPRAGSSASLYSGFQEMNTSDATFVSVDRLDGVYDSNPFGRQH